MKKVAVLDSSIVVIPSEDPRMSVGTSVIVVHQDGEIFPGQVIATNRDVHVRMTGDRVPEDGSFCSIEIVDP